MFRTQFTEKSPVYFKSCSFRESKHNLCYECFFPNMNIQKQWPHEHKQN